MKNEKDMTLVAVDTADRETSEVIVNPSSERIEALARVLDLLEVQEALTHADTSEVA